MKNSDSNQIYIKSEHVTELVNKFQLFFQFIPNTN